MDCLQWATYSSLLGAAASMTGLDTNVKDKYSGSASKGSNKVIPTFYHISASRHKAIECGCFLFSDCSTPRKGTDCICHEDSLLAFRNLI